MVSATGPAAPAVEAAGYGTHAVYRLPAGRPAPAGRACCPLASSLLAVSGRAVA